MADSFVAIRWFMAGFFVSLGTWFVVERARFGSSPVPSCSLADEDERRVDEVVARRRALDHSPNGAFAMAMGCVSFACAGLALLTRLPLASLFALDALVHGALLTAAFVRPRRDTRRAASLRGPAPTFVLPFVVAIAAIAGPLLWADVAPLTATAVCLVGAGLLVCATAVVRMPAQLVGDDVAAERYVDARLRRVRTWQVLALAVGPAWVFEAFTMPFVVTLSAEPSLAVTRAVVAGVTLVVMLAFVWRSLAVTGGDRPSDVARMLRADA